MEDQKDKVATKTLESLGGNLPLGVLNQDGAYAKALRVKKWRMKEERQLGNLGAKDGSIARFASAILSTMVETVGVHNFANEDMKQEEKLLHISQMWMPDVFYSYVWLRVAAMGNLLQLNLTCPYNSGHKFPYTADLNTTEVRVCDNLEDASWEHTLIEPFEIRGKVVKGLKMGPPRWSVLESMGDDGGTNAIGAKIGIIHGSIHGVIFDSGLEVIPLAIHEIDDMCKPDVEALAAALDDHAIGPDMTIESRCPVCDKAFKVPIDWSYEGFFGNSSR